MVFVVVSPLVEVSDVSDLFPRTRIVISLNILLVNGYFVPGITDPVPDVSEVVTSMSNHTPGLL